MTIKKTNWKKLLKELYWLNSHYHDKPNKENTDNLIKFLNENFEKLYWEWHSLDYTIRSDKKYRCNKHKGHDEGVKNEK